VSPADLKKKKITSIKTMPEKVLGLSIINNITNSLLIKLSDSLVSWNNHLVLLSHHASHVRFDLAVRVSAGQVQLNSYSSKLIVEVNLGRLLVAHDVELTQLLGKPAFLILQEHLLSIDEGEIRVWQGVIVDLLGFISMTVLFYLPTNLTLLALGVRLLLLVVGDLLLLYISIGNRNFHAFHPFWRLDILSKLGPGGLPLLVEIVDQALVLVELVRGHVGEPGLLISKLLLSCELWRLWLNLKGFPDELLVVRRIFVGRHHGERIKHVRHLDPRLDHDLFSRSVLHYLRLCNEQSFVNLLGVCKTEYDGEICNLPETHWCYWSAAAHSLLMATF
jgi:hypothetical protein